MATPRPKARVKIEGIAELQARMKHPQLVLLPFQNMLRTAASEGREAAKEPLENTRGGVGAAAETIWANYPKGIAGKASLSASVTSLMAREVSMSIDKGRKRGTWVPVKALANWLTRHEPAARLWMTKEWARSPEGRKIGHTLYYVRDLIHKHGTVGKKFRDAAKRRVQEVLPGLRAGLDAEIERRWGGFRK